MKIFCATQRLTDCLETQAVNVVELENAKSLPDVKTAVPNLLAFYVITNRMLPIRLKK